jgi:hypothetical protein
MTDFSFTARHLADGRVAAERLMEELAQAAAQSAEATAEVPQSVPARRSFIRLWDRPKAA